MTADVLSFEELQTFVIRPFVLVVRLDAPILERFRRMTRYATPSSFLGGLILIISLDCRLAKHHISLEKFIIDHDAEVYGRHLLKVQIDGHSPIQELEKLVHLRIDNSFQSISEFHAHLNSLDLLNADRLRPQWDTYFMVRTAVPPFPHSRPLSPSPSFPHPCSVILCFRRSPPTSHNHNHTCIASIIMGSG